MTMLELIKRFLRPKMTALLILACIQPSASASQPLLHHAQVFLNSIYTNAFIHAPRIGIAALHTYIDHPSALQKLLQGWGFGSTDVIATYNTLTNTLVLQPNMTTYDPEFAGHRISSLQEIRQELMFTSRMNAAVIFHELSHAEFDLYVEEGAENFDRELMEVMNAELPAIASLNQLSPFKSVALSSEIFAHYREELANMILHDVAELRLASGVDPDLHACATVHSYPNRVGSYLLSYAARLNLKSVYVAGVEVKLDIDPTAAKRLNAALFAHSLASLKFPKNRAAINKGLRADPGLKKAMTKCRKIKLSV